MTRAAGQTPWWLAEGDEECPHCGQRHHLEQQRRCRACDCASCAHCVEGLDGLCPECLKEAQS